MSFIGFIPAGTSTFWFNNTFLQVNNNENGLYAYISDSNEVFYSEQQNVDAPTYHNSLVLSIRGVGVKIANMVNSVMITIDDTHRIVGLFGSNIELDESGAFLSDSKPLIIHNQQGKLLANMPIWEATLTASLNQGEQYIGYTAEGLTEIFTTEDGSKFIILDTGRQDVCGECELQHARMVRAQDICTFPSFEELGIEVTDSDFSDDEHNTVEVGRQGIQQDSTWIICNYAAQTISMYDIYLADTTMWPSGELALRIYAVQGTLYVINRNRVLGICRPFRIAADYYHSPSCDTYIYNVQNFGHVIYTTFTTENENGMLFYNLSKTFKLMKTFYGIFMLRPGYSECIEILCQSNDVNVVLFTVRLEKLNFTAAKFVARSDEDDDIFQCPDLPNGHLFITYHDNDDLYEIQYHNISPHQRTKMALTLAD